MSINWIYKVIFLISVNILCISTAYPLTMNFYRDTIALNNKDKNQSLWICEQYIKKGKLKRALFIAQKIIREENNNLKAHAIIAASYKGLGLNEKFDKEVIIIKKLAPNLSILYITLGDAYLGLKQYSLAEKMYKKAISCNQYSSKAKIRLANFYITNNRFNKAYHIYKLLIKNNKLSTQQFLVINLKLCKLNFILKNYNENIKICKKLIKLYPNIPVSYIYLSKSYLAKNRIDLAIDNYKLLIKLLPNYVNTYQEIALVYIDKLNDMPNALKYIKRAINKFPNNAKNYDILGWIYYKNANYEKALKYFKVASNLGHNPIYLYHLGITYKKQSNLLKAQKIFKQAIKSTKLSKASKLYKQIETQLRSIQTLD